MPKQRLVRQHWRMKYTYRPEVAVICPIALPPSHLHTDYKLVRVTTKLLTSIGSAVFLPLSAPTQDLSGQEEAVDGLTQATPLTVNGPTAEGLGRLTA